MELSREWVGVRAAILLTFAAAALSVGTGLIAISNPGAVRTGPLAVFVPPLVQATVAFTGTLTGFLLLAAAIALGRRLRAGWTAAVALLPLSAAQGLLQSTAYSLPLVALSLAALPVVALNRSRFARPLDLTSTQAAAALAIVGAQLYGTVGTYALRDEFDGIANRANFQALVDAFWYTIVTGSTVGYGDVTPITARAKLFGISMLLVSVASFAVALGVLLTPAIEARLSKALGRMTESDLDALDDHVIVLGYGDLTEPILEELGEKTRFLVVTENGDQARLLTERGVDVLTGDPSDDDPLRRAGIERARAVVAATNDDAQDALAVLTARELNPGVRIVAAATNRENAPKLRRAGADTVVSPAVIGGHLLVESALGGEDTEQVAERLVEGDGSDAV